ncbi:MAG: penicillin-binding protein activator [Burkholderiales bacterium]|nr:penicillin-binding protein activator [Burkholderiales bacterium]
MQRFLPLLTLCAALYGCTSTPIIRPSSPPFPAEPQVVQPEQPAPEIPEAETAPLSEYSIPPAAAVLPGSASRKNATGDIALILPLQSQSFSAAAKAVHDGFVAAHSLAGKRRNLPVVIYSTGDQVADILAAYEQAVQAGSSIVVGPLTRDGVTALANSNVVSVPTLALNIPERNIPIPDNLYLFGLQIEAEARQIARLAIGQGKRSALTVSGDTALSRRIHLAFLAEWNKLGGTIIDQFRYSTDPNELARLRSAATSGNADMVFLAVEFQKARVVRPYLDIEIPVYATSQVFNGGADSLANFDLNGVRFVDMPWLLQADHPAVMVYPRPQGATSMDLERLYALGVDAFRIAQYLAQPDSGSPIIDGVTGRITLEANHQFVRELSQAQFDQGNALVIDPKR